MNLNASSNSEWGYYFVSPNGTGSTLRTRGAGTVSSTGLVPNNGNGSSVGYSANATTYLYTITENTDGSYNLGKLKSESGLTSGEDYAIVLEDNGKNYIVSRNNSGSIFAQEVNSILDLQLGNNQIWHASSTSALSCVMNDTTYYLSVSRDYLALSTSSTTTWTFTRSGTNSGTFASSNSVNNNANSRLSIFKVDKNDELDRITDVETLLTSKMLVTASVSLQTSSNYVIASKITVNGEDAYYGLAMKSMTDTIAIDISDLMKDALDNGSTITLFDSTVWKQDGQDYTLFFDNIGFFDENYHYLTGASGNRNESMQPIVSDLESIPNDMSEYTWRTYKVNGDYLFGFTENDIVYYLYFDSSSLEFKLTTSSAIARNGLVQLYQLGAELSSLNFITVNLDLASDGVTILNYPLKQVESDEIITYSETVVEGNRIVNGEYVILAHKNNSYYALTYNEEDELSFVDVMFYFMGNYSKDANDNYCFSVNERYVWKQMGSNGTLTFQNYALGNTLSIGDTTSLTYSNHQLKGGNYYLNFDCGVSYTTSTSTSGVEILIYEVGTHGVAVTDPESDLNYTYYHTALSTSVGSGVSYANFAFEKVEIPNLQDYSYDQERNALTATDGWKIFTTNETLHTVNSSVYFKGGINYNSDANTFKNEFNEFTYVYDDVENSTTHNMTYYIPDGALGFVIPYAGPTEPVFINVIASTELDSTLFNIDYLRYLSIWKVADLDLENFVFTPITGDSANAEGFANALISRFERPYAAIPLANHYGSVASGASLVCVAENNTVNDYNLINIGTNENPLSYDHLIAHTFCITSPGVYYLGTTYGTVAISYITIDNMYVSDVGEDNSTSISDEFTIDFVWGTINSSATSGENYSIGANDTIDEAVGTIGYVGYVGTNTVSNDTITDPSWVHSNIFPHFTNGTAGLVSTIPDERSESYNPTDTLSLSVTRTFTYDESVSQNLAISTVTITGETLEYIKNHDDIKYINDNTLLQRRTRLVSFTIDVIEEENNGD